MVVIATDTVVVCIEQSTLVSVTDICYCDKAILLRVGSFCKYWTSFFSF